MRSRTIDRIRGEKRADAEGVAPRGLQSKFDTIAKIETLRDGQFESVLIEPDVLRTQMDAAAFEAAWRFGETMSRDQIVAYVMTEDE